MDLNQASEAISSWQEEDSKNRTVIVIAVERNEETGTDAKIAIQGNKEVIKTVLKHLLKTGESQEIQEILLKTYMETFIEMINDNMIQTNNENKEEE